MRRAFKYRLYPTKAQGRELAFLLEAHRRFYNEALAERIDAYKAEKKTLKLKHQYPVFSARRKADSGLNGRMYAASMRDTIGRLDRAFDAFFRRLKAGDEPGFPRFRGRNGYDSIPFGNTFEPDDPKSAFGAPGCVLLKPAPGRFRRLQVFGIGEVKVRQHRPLQGRVKAATVKRENGKWYVVFSCDLGGEQAPFKGGPAVGIDVGLKAFLTTSDREVEPNPGYLKKELPKLKRLQRTASRRFRRGKARHEQSKRYRKACKRVAALHERVKNKRKEHHCQTANKLVRRFGTICVEDLNIRGMVRNGKLSRAIADAAWGGFVQILKHKAESAGVQVIEVDPRGTTQDCSGCGKTVRKGLGERRHSCPYCGLSLDRDHNAALNILQRGAASGKVITAAGANGQGAVSSQCSASVGSYGDKSTTNGTCNGGEKQGRSQNGPVGVRRQGVTTPAVAEGS